MDCKGLHCTGCGGSRGAAAGGGVLALVVLVVLIAAAAASPHVRRAADTTARAVLTAAEITGLVVVSLAGVGLLAGGVLVVVRVRRGLVAHRASELERRAAAAPVYSITEGRPALRAIPGPRPTYDVAQLPDLGNARAGVIRRGRPGGGRR